MSNYPKLIISESKEAYELRRAEETAAFGGPLREHILEKGENGGDFIAVLAEESAEGVDGGFRLRYDSGGVALELIPRLGGGSEADRAKLWRYLERKRLRDLNKQAVQSLLALSYGIKAIAPPQQEYFYGEELELTFSKDLSKAFIRVLPAEEGGSLLTMEEALSELKSKGLNFGLDEELLAQAIAEGARGKEYLIARGQPPVEGENGRLIFHFKRNHSGAPIISEEGDRADYKNLDLYSSVRAGDLLVTRVAAVQGKNGHNVRGEALPPKPVMEARAPGGRNVEYDEERLNMRAKVSGRVDYKDGLVIVSDVYEIQGDADYSVGSIDFQGDVVIRGSVISNLSIKATGNIEIFGLVQSSSLFAGNDVLLHRGMAGGDKGLIEAGGSVTAKFLESCTVRSRGGVLANTIIHSLVETEGTVEAKGRQGSIIGGTVRAEKSISAQNIGSVASTKTLLEVGIPPSKRLRLQAVEAEIPRLEEQADKCEKIIRYLGSLDKMSEERRGLLKSTIVARAQTRKELADRRGELEELNISIENVGGGSVRATDTIYGGVRLTISSASLLIEDPVRRANYKLSEGEVKYMPF